MCAFLRVCERASVSVRLSVCVCVSCVCEYGLASMLLNTKRSLRNVIVCVCAHVGRGDDTTLSTLTQLTTMFRDVQRARIGSFGTDLRFCM